MFLDARDPKTHGQAMLHKVINLDTGEDIPRVIWADDETGEYEQVLTDENGRTLMNESGDKAQSRVFTGNIKMVME
jgi:hypothetical protein